MKIIEKLKKKYEEWRLSKYYLSIKDCPMYNWIRLYEEQDLKYLIKTGRICKRAEIAYNRLQDQVIDNFGVNEDFLKIIRNKIKIELYYAKQIATGDRSTQAFIDILEIQNNDLASKQTRGDIYELVIAVEKIMGFKINPKKISIYDFYKYTNELKKLKNG